MELAGAATNGMVLQHRVGLTSLKMYGQRDLWAHCRGTCTFAAALPAIDAGSFGVVLIAGKHVCMFRMCGCISTRAHAMSLEFPSKEYLAWTF